ncbi:MAG: iron-containing alcohol dehydrogenase [Ruminococcaceae bacterium]|nr:iron-containing alcohol dehydrogenase [Oscillospiraceae bacterium]
MNNFVYHSPTKVYFGQGYESQIGALLKEHGFRKPLMVYGGGSIKRSGLYDTVTASLKDAGLTWAELPGVQPNPLLGLAKQGIALFRAEQCDVLLAVGGGSTIDTAKVIGLGVPYDGDVWDFWCGKADPKTGIPTVAILTIAAAGSETSESAVITNEDGMQKKGRNSIFNRPLFSILNPALTATLPAYQTACGAVDIMMHTLERYLTLPGEVELTDRIAESVLLTVRHWAPVAIAEPDNYEARAQLMWAGSLSHNDLTGCGHASVFINHKIGHELSATHDTAHGASLAIAFPAWAKYSYLYNVPRFAQYAVRVWGCEMDYQHPENTALAGIQATEDFFRSLGMPVRLSYIDVPESEIDLLANRITANGKLSFKSYVDCGTKEFTEILKLAK